MASNPENSDRVEPFLRWAGGKRFLVKRFRRFVPHDLRDRVYREPFLGSASLFFALQPKKAILSDANEHLIFCYKYIRDYPTLIADYLREHGKRSCEQYYYEIREVYNCSSFSAAQAGRFIYLNRTCFNGIFRVNRKGEFNVPYGWKEPPILPDRKWLRRVSTVLTSVVLKSASFEKALASASSGDFIYLDPPYPPLNHTANFTRYTKDRFGETDQKRLADTLHDLDARGCLVMMSNADIPLVRQLYERFNVASLPVTRYVTCKSRKHQVRELIITNYGIRGRS